jgi:hypothetical protein
MTQIRVYAKDTRVHLKGVRGPFRVLRHFLRPCGGIGYDVQHLQSGRYRTVPADQLRVR